MNKDSIVNEIEIMEFVDKHYGSMFALYTLVTRSLPSVRDGLSTVQRRLLWAAMNMSIWGGKTPTKSARLVGEVMANYHPHGDLSIYQALVNTTASFKNNHPLFDGQGNYGKPLEVSEFAAMRYTETMASDISRNVFEKFMVSGNELKYNYDQTKQEPSCLTALLPASVLNVFEGIAVGKRVYIPSHNLQELISVICEVLQTEDCLLSDALLAANKYITGPDFPTGGLLYKQLDTYILYPKYEFIKNSIIYTEIPISGDFIKVKQNILNAFEKSNLSSSIEEGDDYLKVSFSSVKEKTLVHTIVMNNLSYSFTPILNMTDGNNVILFQSIGEVIYYFLLFRIDLEKELIEAEIQKEIQSLKILELDIKAVENIHIISSYLNGGIQKEEVLAYLDIPETDLDVILKKQLGSLIKKDLYKLKQQEEDTQTKIESLNVLCNNPKEIRRRLSNKVEHLRVFAIPRRTKITGERPVEVYSNNPSIEIEDVDLAFYLTKYGVVKIQLKKDKLWSPSNTKDSLILSKSISSLTPLVFLKTDGTVRTEIAYKLWKKCIENGGSHLSEIDSDLISIFPKDQSCVIYGKSSEGNLLLSKTTSGRFSGTPEGVIFIKDKKQQVIGVSDAGCYYCHTNSKPFKVTLKGNRWVYKDVIDPSSKVVIITDNFATRAKFPIFLLDMDLIGTFNKTTVSVTII